MDTRLHRFVSGPWPFIIPALFALIVMRAFPAVWQIWLSMTDMRLGDPGSFVGLANFRAIFGSSAFLGSISYTAIFLVFTVAGQMALGLCLALILEGDYRGRDIYRTLFLIPWVISGLVAGIMWQLMFVETRTGLLNAFIGQFGMNPIRWLSNPTNARVSVIMVYIWKGVGFSMLLLSGGLKTIPDELLESADIDGASAWRKLFSIKIPMMKEIVSVNFIFATIAALNSYETVLVLTNGGPGGATSLIALEMFRTAFGESRNQLGRGSAIGVVMFAVTLVFVIIYVRMTRFGKENY
ncbi:MAG: sugar ABC transporter permease [Spirochaetaceae bacterium]|nr:MAG: sugar ABC transporter permease [Spirochaetaceae bacterium]